VDNFSGGCDGNSKLFQGQLSWRPPVAGQLDSTDGPTEVRQAIKILRELWTKIVIVKLTIADLADRMETLLPKDSPIRNELYYGWKDRVMRNGLEVPGEEFYHLVRVKLDAWDYVNNKPTGYPKTELQHIIETQEWLSLEKCRILKNYKGSFQITASRYDQDTPVLQWQLRRRGQPKSPEFPVNKLVAMVNDIQNTGWLNLSGGAYNQADVNSLFDVNVGGYPGFAISSAAEGYYGIEKDDIYIKRLR